MLLKLHHSHIYRSYFEILIVFCFLPQGVDDAESECDLDSVTPWDLEIDNSQDEEEHLLSVFDSLVALCSKRLTEAKCKADGKTRG